VGKNKKLTDSEIDLATQKVRRLYNDYIIRYEKPPSVREDFEFRLGQMKRIEGNITVFLHAEISALTELISRE
jgi:hypothetical protein